MEEGFDENSVIRILGGSMVLLLSYIAGKHVPWGVKNQNKHYQSLTEHLQKEGYKEEFCERYMSYPCGRSVVKTALKRTDHFEKYQELKKKYPLTRIG